MDNVTVPITATVKGGMMLASGGVVADLVIFNDPLYLYSAIIGAIVSLLGVLHESLENSPTEQTKTQIVVELIKGLVLGILAIPFFYLTLSQTGESVLMRVFGLEVGGIGNSVWLLISFALSWFTVPIFDWIVKVLKFKASKHV